ncbi:TetR/AcrR family transcriptional regulator [Nocardioides hwasunensis]|uniref:TetR/AcrR family transcriptional regulator n=1 Tax=Nocardioides hwasunensis TaxID=397258 RepID=A0ABR8MF09_9ACTN|nr:TetR/AcrR family transcriptional regulator [Nocardioides hwasunensis]MBD3914681.1 TetR/AcrR family transcriptional regulator [Nocardioides hwasunensis]
MPTPYHHGSLRDSLLEAGRRQLLEEGVASLTLRGLAKRVGVSHSAPLRHFDDRDALLDAIAAAGFAELISELESAAGLSSLRARLTQYARAHARFALESGPLLELMFSVGPGGGAAEESAARFFALGGELLGERADRESGPLPYLLAATLEGIGSLVASGRLPVERVDEVVDEAVSMLLPAVEARLSS